MTGWVELAGRVEPDPDSEYGRRPGGPISDKRPGRGRLPAFRTPESTLSREPR